MQFEKQLMNISDFWTIIQPNMFYRIKEIRHDLEIFHLNLNIYLT